MSSTNVSNGSNGSSAQPQGPPVDQDGDVIVLGSSVDPRRAARNAARLGGGAPNAALNGAAAGPANPAAGPVNPPPVNAPAPIVLDLVDPPAPIVLDLVDPPAPAVLAPAVVVNLVRTSFDFRGCGFDDDEAREIREMYFDNTARIYNGNITALLQDKQALYQETRGIPCPMYVKMAREMDPAVGYHPSGLVYDNVGKPLNLFGLPGTKKSVDRFMHLLKVELAKMHANGVAFGQDGPGEAGTGRSKIPTWNPNRVMVPAYRTLYATYPNAYALAVAGFYSGFMDRKPRAHPSNIALMWSYVTKKNKGPLFEVKWDEPRATVNMYPRYSGNPVRLKPMPRKEAFRASRIASTVHKKNMCCFVMAVITGYKRIHWVDWAIPMTEANNYRLKLYTGEWVESFFTGVTFPL